MNYCSHCGAPVVLRIPEGDTLPRHVCPSCGTVHYQNPKVVVGCLVEWNNRVLLCRRAIDPRRGYWTLPAGFLENRETTLQGAVRETLEEAQAQVTDAALFSLLNVSHINQIHIFYRARLVDGAFAAGHETLEADLFAEGDIRWQELAFPTVLFTLERYYQDRRNRRFGVHIEDISADAWRKLGLTGGGAGHS